MIHTHILKARLLFNTSMKKNIFYSFLLFTSLLLAQENQDKTIFLDSLNKEATIENYSYKRIIKDYYKDKSEYQYLDYFKSGSLKSSKTLSGKDSGYFIGEEINYFPNGNKKESSFYENKRLSGKHKVWYENGQLKEEGTYDPERKESKEYYLVESIWDEKGNKLIENGNGKFDFNSDKSETTGEYKNGMKNGAWTFNSKSFSYTDEYKDGEFISGYSIRDGIKTEYTILEKKPEPAKGGVAAFYKFISKQFNMTPEAMTNKVQGKIFLSFVVDKDGSLTDIKVIRGLGYGLDEEAMRVLRICPLWIPGEQRGIKVKCKYTLPISVDYSK